MSRFNRVVIDHFTSPRNLGRIAAPDARAFVGNPVCGDQILFTATFDGEVLHEIQFEARGCAASIAVGSVIADSIAGCTVADLEQFAESAVVERIGVLPPEQRHVVQLATDAVHRLATSRRTGILDEPVDDRDGEDDR